MIARLCLMLLLLAGICGCRTMSNISPDRSSRPPELGEAFKHASLASAPRADWSLFDDAELLTLLDRFDQHNPSVAAALARVDEAQARYGLTAVAKTPVIRGNGAAAWRRDSESGFFVPDPPDYEQFQLGLDLSYELDLWGRVRRDVEASQADLNASEYDAVASLLPLRAQLVRTWFQLQFLEIERLLLVEAIALREESMTLIDAQVRGGDATEVDLARARTELLLTQAAQHEIGRQQDTLIHLVASLCGAVPGEFVLPPIPVPDASAMVPIPDAGLPSSLLTRRPDLHAAEQRLAAAHARLGLSKASYLPRFTLGAGAGLSSLSLSDLLDVKSLFTSIGPDVTIPLYNGGRNKQDAALANAAIQLAHAEFKQTALIAVRDVEDALAGLRWLDKHIVALNEAVEAANETARLSTRRYDVGVASYLEVVDAQRTALNARRELAGIRAARRLAIVDLVQALGGGWTAAP